ncbi:aprataxin and PNK-like factor isoform X2 [Topomyia yanbarensis]|uniref:aprataxin and PNK-like factor isoform X2 n=1 Tax=Topomyia yanbarensis TaxID=2498891 RepID=UPI00273BCFEA|nr:aprataxin and PNK-like factor isoform X2 [Topomyia yanbarensis]
MASQLYLYDCEKEVDIHVPSAETVIGRDSILQCDDKRISRQHGIIKVDSEQTGSVQITSTHSNPIFIRTSDNVLNILTKDLTATLRQGEKFALLPDQYWYEVRFRTLEEQQEAAVSSSSNGGTLRVRTMEEVNGAVATSAEKRTLPDWIADSSEKRKISDGSEAENCKKTKTELASSSEAAIREETAAVDGNQPDSVGPESSSVEMDQAIKPDPDASEASTSRPKSPQQSAENAVKVEVKKETADSTGPPPRPSCEFGIRCYRHNPEHRAQFSHPNDGDYRRPTFPPAPDDAPHCPFGVSCYRRNPQHFREYQHPDSTSVTPVIQVPVNLQQQPQQQPLRRPSPNDGGQRRRQRRRNLARDIVIAAIANPGLFAGSDEEDDDEDLFDYESDSDEYRPGRESSDDDDEVEEIDSRSFYEAEE